MQKSKIGLLVGLLVGAFTVTPAAATQPTITIRVATPFATGHILADTAFKFKEVMENLPVGKFVVNVSTAVLNEQTINPQMTSCSAGSRVAEVMLTGGQPLQDWAPAYFFFNGPYVIADYDHFRNVWTSHLGSEAKALMRQNGNLTTLGTVYRGFRQFTSNTPINGPSDFVGLKLRLPPAPDWISVWSSLDVTPVTVPLTGIYAALADGTADASEGDLTQIQSLALYEVQSHLTLTNHLVGFGLALANHCFLQDLSVADKLRVLVGMQVATNWGTNQMESREATLLTQLQSEGMTVVTPDAEAIRTEAEPAINDLFATKWTVTDWDEVRSYQ